MRFKTMIFLATAALCGGAASAQSSEPADAPVAEAKPVAACGHKFETSIQTLTNGKPHTSQVKLCGEAGQTDAQWMITLKDALSKVEANAKMPAEVKTQIAVALRSEIGKVENNGAGGGILHLSPTDARCFCRWNSTESFAGGRVRRGLHRFPKMRENLPKRAVKRQTRHACKERSARRRGG